MASTQSTRYYIINDIKSKIEENSNIKYVDLYNGQENRAEEEQSFDRPAVLIEIEQIEWDKTGHVASGINTDIKQEKKGFVRFNLHFWFHYYDYEITRFQQTDSIIQAIDKSIESMYSTTKGYRQIKKIEERQGAESTGQWIWVISYEAPAEEEGVTKGLIHKTGVSPSITVDIVENV